MHSFQPQHGPCNRSLLRTHCVRIKENWYFLKGIRRLLSIRTNAWSISNDLLHSSPNVSILFLNYHLISTMSSSELGFEPSPPPPPLLSFPCIHTLAENRNGNQLGINVCMLAGTVTIYVDLHLHTLFNKSLIQWYVENIHPWTSIFSPSVRKLKWIPWACPSY